MWIVKSSLQHDFDLENAEQVVAYDAVQYLRGRYQERLRDNSYLNNPTHQGESRSNSYIMPPPPNGQEPIDKQAQEKLKWRNVEASTLEKLHEDLNITSRLHGERHNHQLAKAKLYKNDFMFNKRIQEDKIQLLEQRVAILEYLLADSSKMETETETDPNQEE